MSDRKLTLEVIVDQDSDEWKWIYETLTSEFPKKGMRILSIANDWTSEKHRDLLMRNHNLLSHLKNKLEAKP